MENGVSMWCLVPLLVVLVQLAMLVWGSRYIGAGYRRRAAIPVAHKLYTDTGHVYVVGRDTALDIPAGATMEVLYYPPGKPTP